MRSVTLALSLLVAVTAWATDPVIVEDWTKLAAGAKGIPDGWKGGQTWGFPKHDFTIVDNDGRRVLHLRSKDETSTVSQDIKGKVKLKETPILEWSWKVVTLPKGADSRSKHTDDQAAQLYVAWPRFPQTVRSRIIGYIWDTTAPQGLVVQSEKTGTVTYVNGSTMTEKTKDNAARGTASRSPARTPATAVRGPYYFWCTG